MEIRRHLPFLLLSLASLAGCKSHPLTDYRPLDKAGMWSSNMEELKKLNTSDVEVAQVVRLKQAGFSDDTCVALVAAARQYGHPFNSAESAVSLVGAGYQESQILDFGRSDRLDSISSDAVMLRLIGLSDATTQVILQRHVDNQPVLSSSEIARLKNTGLTERQILDRINQGMTDEQAEKEIASRNRARNQTGFVRVQGRTPR